MLTFKAPNDIEKLSPADPAHATVKELVDQLITAYTEPGQPYNHEDNGYVILIEPEDVDRELDGLWDSCRLTNIYWEGIMLRGDFFIAASTDIRIF